MNACLVLLLEVQDQSHLVSLPYMYMYLTVIGRTLLNMPLAHRDSQRVILNGTYIRIYSNCRQMPYNSFSLYFECHIGEESSFSTKI